jgi:hypothetical protein
MQITTSTIRSFTFIETQKFQELFVATTTRQITVNFSIPLKWAPEKSTLDLPLLISLNGEEVLKCQWQLVFSEVESTTTLKELFNHDLVKAAVLRVNGTILNMVNWIFMNTNIGPLPIHAHGLMSVILQSVGQEPTIIKQS